MIPPIVIVIRKIGTTDDNIGFQVLDCVPDSSNAVEAEEEADDEQHSSGSVDEVTDYDHDDYDADYD